MKHITTLFAILFSINYLGQGSAPRMEAKIDQVVNLYGLSGEGVLAVVIDRGIDYENADFIDENGNTRIKYIFDMIDNSGVNDPDNTYGVGTIFSESEINDALSNNDPSLTTDRYGHGTATAGIIGGNGSGTAGLEFQGVAPNINYVIIKLTHDPFPAFGAEPQQSAFFDPTYIPIALDFAADKIEEIGLPSVTLMNIGSTGGPTDGSSLICQAIDDFVALGNPFVCGVGDDGGDDNHSSTSISQDETIEIEINKANNGFLRFDLWYSENDRFTVSIERPNGTVHGPFNAPTAANDSEIQNFSDVVMYHMGASLDFYGASSNRREILIDLSGVSGIYKVVLNGESIQDDGLFHATLNPGNGFNNNRFLNYVSPGGSIADYASCLGSITPTDYVVQNEWTDINGIFQDITGQGEDGEIWLGSSAGPTQDDRYGVDFAAPGEVCFAAYSEDTYYANFPHNIIQGSNGKYGVQNAVSACAPLVTGVIAFMLELNPNLTPTEILEILKETSVEDSFTGSTPNNTWGYGKLDALSAIEEAIATVGIIDFEPDDYKTWLFPNPTKGEFALSINSPEKRSDILIEIVNSIGVIEISRQINDVSSGDSSLQFDLSKMPSGTYFVRVLFEKKIFILKLIRL